MAETFHFAWVDESETTFNSVTHARQDEDVYSLTIGQREGEFATAEVEIENPGEGLLNVARQQYAWISVTKDAVTTALCFGRVTAFPEEFVGQTVRLSFIAQFPGWQTNLQTLFNSLKVLPFWDEAFIAPTDRDRPETALESRSAVYHFPRTSPTITLSDVLTGDSTTTISNHFREPFNVSRTGSPARRVSIRADVAWEQRISGITTRVNDDIRRAFSSLDVNTLTPEAIVNSWPKAGDVFGGGGGYEVVYSSIKETTAVLPFRSPTSVEFHQATTPAERTASQVLFGTRVDSRYATVPRKWYKTRILTRYDFRQSRSETILATVENDVQPLAFDQDGGTIDINLSAEDVVGLGLVPASTSSYFLTARGVNSFKHLLARARSHLAIAARAIEISFEIPFFDGLTLSCLNSIELQDSRIPGGSATGKIIAYELSVDGDTGTASCSVTIGVSVGNGQSYSPGGVTGDYCSAGYTGTVYQVGEGEEGAAVGSPDIIFAPYVRQAPVDPLVIRRLRNGDVVQSVTITNEASDQNTALLANQYPQRNDVSGVLSEYQTQIKVEMRDLAAVDSLTHTISVSIPHPWAAPAGIDLAA
jgi:hypothetical protein